MRVALTGGGTGGHVYPALEVGRAARVRGADLLYLGSLRGMEAEASRRADVPFQGFASEPLGSLKTLGGLRSLFALTRARAAARRYLKEAGVDVVFSTGGYSAAPVMSAAVSLGVPLVVHEANSVPGRANRLFAPKAKAFTYVFRATEAHLPSARTNRAGQPVREGLREAARGREPDPRRVLVVGGSQGSLFLNRLLTEAKPLLGGYDVTLVAGKGQYDRFAPHDAPRFAVRPFLDADAMAEAYRTAGTVVARSGGSLAEFAAFRLPSVLVPLPTSADHHQWANAREFEAMHAAALLWQPGSVPPAPAPMATPEALLQTLDAWTEPRRASAVHNLEGWDVPDATARIVAHLF